MNGWVNECVGECTDGWLNGWLIGCMVGWLNVCVVCLLVVGLDLLGLWRGVKPRKPIGRGPLAWTYLP